MSQKEKNKEENAFWQPYETFQSHVQAEIKKQDQLLRQSWKLTSQHVTEQREKAQQLYEEVSNKNVYQPQSEAWKNIASQTQAILKTPIDFTLDLIEKTDRERSERTQVLVNLHDQFISASKQNQLAFMRLAEKNLQKTAGV
jgi:hypothetical protein